ncbi:MAG: hypothetical protein AB7T06_16670 [Kofleriaceae bacterium]
MAAGKGRSFTGGRFALDVAGHNVGFLKSCTPPNLAAEIAENDTGPDNRVYKHVTTIKPTEAKCKMGIGMGKGMYEWIKQSFDKQFEPRSGSFTSADFDYLAQSTCTFHDALITSVTIPKMDGASKEAAYFDISFDAERVEWAKAGGENIKAKFGVKQKTWLCCNFKLEIDGMKTDRVATVESFTWKCSVVRDQIGTTKWSTIHPAKVTTPEIKFSVSYDDHDGWAKWANEWFVKGRCEDGDEKGGRLVFLAPDMNRELGHIEFDHLGLSKFEDAEAVANAENIKRFNVTMYCEAMKFVLTDVDS